MNSKRTSGRTKGDTKGQTSCAVPDTSKIRDPQAERVLLAGLLHDGRDCLKELEATGVSRADFYEDANGRLFDLCCYVANGIEGPLMADVFLEMTVRREYCDCPGPRAAAAWLAEVWFSDPWIGDIQAWVDPDNPVTAARTFAALAAAAKLRHLSARRRTVYAALEAIRDAVDPTGDAEYLEGRAEDVGNKE